MIKTVIFDFDGTIADTFNLTTELINSIAIKYNIEPFTNENIERLKSKKLTEIFSELHIPLFKAPAIINDIKHLISKEITTQQPITGMPEVITQLVAHAYSLSIVTSNTPDTVTNFLHRHQLEYFDHIYSDKSLFGKHVVLNNFIKKHSINREEAIYVGDEIRDIEAAHKAKLKIIAVTWGFNSKAGLRQYQPDYLVDTPQQLVETINQL